MASCTKSPDTNETFYELDVVPVQLFILMYDANGKLSEDKYRVKVGAGSHIDELTEVSLPQSSRIFEDENGNEYDWTEVTIYNLANILDKLNTIFK